MNPILKSATLLLMFVFGVCAAEPTTLKITDFHQGLIQFDQQGKPHIYKPGNTFPYQINGTCVAAGKEYPCMWHGFEFSFAGPDDESQLDCTSVSSRPRKEVNPSQLKASHVESVNWGFVITGKKGYYIRPQYTFDVKDSDFRDSTRCTYKGQEVLSFELLIQASQ